MMMKYIKVNIVLLDMILFSVSQSYFPIFVEELPVRFWNELREIDSKIWTIYIDKILYRNSWPHTIQNSLWKYSKITLYIRRLCAEGEKEESSLPVEFDNVKVKSINEMSPKRLYICGNFKLRRTGIQENNLDTILTIRAPKVFIVNITVYKFFTLASRFNCKYTFVNFESEGNIYSYCGSILNWTMFMRHNIVRVHIHDELKATYFEFGMTYYVISKLINRYNAIYQNYLLDSQFTLRLFETKYTTTKFNIFTAQDRAVLFHIIALKHNCDANRYATIRVFNGPLKSTETPVCVNRKTVFKYTTIFLASIILMDNTPFYGNISNIFIGFKTTLIEAESNNLSISSDMYYVNVQSNQTFIHRVLNLHCEHCFLSVKFVSVKSFTGHTGLQCLYGGFVIFEGSNIKPTTTNFANNVIGPLCTQYGGEPLVNEINEWHFSGPDGKLIFYAFNAYFSINIDIEITTSSCVGANIMLYQKGNIIHENYMITSLYNKSTIICKKNCVIIQTNDFNQREFTIVIKVINGYANAIIKTVFASLFKTKTNMQNSDQMYLLTDTEWVVYSNTENINITRVNVIILKINYTTLFLDLIHRQIKITISHQQFYVYNSQVTLISISNSGTLFNKGVMPYESKPFIFYIQSFYFTYKYFITLSYIVCYCYPGSCQDITLSMKLAKNEITNDLTLQFLPDTLEVISYFLNICMHESVFQGMLHIEFRQIIVHPPTTLLKISESENQVYKFQ